jgi:hypothetical protein
MQDICPTLVQIKKRQFEMHPGGRSGEGSEEKSYLSGSFTDVLLPQVMTSWL